MFPQLATIQKQVAGNPEDFYGKETTTTVATDVPCRLDSIQYQRSVEEPAAAGMQDKRAFIIYIWNDEAKLGKPRNFDEKSWILVDGRRFDITMIHDAYDFSSLHHYEIMAYETINRG
jgi:hypothetical protein